MHNWRAFNLVNIELVAQKQIIQNALTNPTERHRAFYAQPICNTF